MTIGSMSVVCISCSLWFDSSDLTGTNFAVRTIHCLLGWFVLVVLTLFEATDWAMSFAVRVVYVAVILLR